MGILIQVIIKGEFSEEGVWEKAERAGKKLSRDMVLRWRQLQPDPAGNSGMQIVPYTPSWTEAKELGFHIPAIVSHWLRAALWGVNSLGYPSANLAEWGGLQLTKKALRQIKAGSGPWKSGQCPEVERTSWCECLIFQIQWDAPFLLKELYQVLPWHLLEFVRKKVYIEENMHLVIQRKFRK